MEKLSKDIPEDMKKAVDASIEEHNKEIRGNASEAIDASEDMQKAVDASIEEHNKEIRGNASEKVFSKKNKENFEKLEDDDQEALSTIYDNFSVGFKDRYKLVRSKRLYNHHERKGAELEKETKTNKSNIEKIEADIENHDISMANLREQFPDGLSKKAELAAEKEKKRLRKSLKKERVREINLQTKQESNTRKRKEYETNRDEIIERIEIFVGDKIAPYEEKIPGLKEDLVELDTKMESYKIDRDKFTKELEVWEKKVSRLKDEKGEMSGAEKIMYAGKIKEIEDEIGIADFNINSVQKDKNVINGRINGLVVKIDYWNTVLEKSKNGGIAKYPEKYNVDTEGKPVEAKEEEVVANETPEAMVRETTTPEPEVEKAEDTKGYEAWREAVMPSKESENKYNKTKDWYEASGLTEEDMNNVTNTESREPSAEEQKDKEIENPDEASGLTEEEIEVKETPLEDSVESEKNIEEDLGEREVSANEYIKRWNKLFGGKLFASNLKLDSGKLLDVLEMPKGIKKLPLKRVEEGIIEYNKNQSNFSKISEDELSRMFKIIRDTELLGEDSKKEREF